jgi:hypothetical protein
VKAALAEASPAEVAAARIALGKEIIRLRAQLAAAEVAEHAARLSSELLVALNNERDLYEAHRRAKKAAWCTEAAAIDEQATKLEAEYKERFKTTARLLKELEQHEEVPWWVAPPDLTSFGTVARTPKTEVMKLRAGQLRLQAATLRAKRPIENGVVNGANLEQILAGLDADPQRLFPAVSEVLSSAGQAFDSGAARMARRQMNAVTGDRRPFAVRISWQGAAITAKYELPEL